MIAEPGFMRMPHPRFLIRKIAASSIVAKALALATSLSLRGKHF